MHVFVPEVYLADREHTYTVLQQYFFGSSSVVYRRNTEEIPKKYRRNAVESASMVRRMRELKIFLHIIGLKTVFCDYVFAAVETFFLQIAKKVVSLQIKSIRK